MNDAAERAVREAREALSGQPVQEVYRRLSAFGGDDGLGVVALECARLAIAMKAPERALAHLDAARGRAAPALVAFEAGRARNNLRDYRGAADAFERAVELRPDWADAHAARAHVLRAQGDFETALCAYQAALTIAPDHPRALPGAATMYAERGDVPAAIALGERAVARDPDRVDLLVLLGQWHQSVGQPERAVDRLAQAAERTPQDAVVHSALGSARQSAGDLAGAAAAYERALALDPTLASAVAALAGVLDLTGHAEAAAKRLAPFLQSGQPEPVVVLADANLSSRRRIDDETMTRLQTVLGDPSTPPMLRALVMFRYADAMDQRGRTDEAFAFYAQANELRRTRFDTRALAQHTADISARYTRPDQRRALPASERAPWQPVFIVGLPRTGTTLVEQALSAHPAVAGAGELRGLALAGQGATDAAALAHRYRELVEATPGLDLGTSRWCTDKMWQNFERLDVVRAAFPEAVILHCRRHPMATGWSIFRRSFGAAPPPFASAFDDVAAYIAHHEAVMSAWHSAGAPGTVVVHYETLVDRFETEIARLLGALGLEMHPDCLAFHQQKRAVTTQSFGQVNQPLYRSGLDSWRRYAGHLSPLAAALEKLGVDPEGRAGAEAP